MVSNTSLIFANVPSGLPKPGTDIKKETNEFDVQSADLQGGLLIKSLAFSLDPYMRGRMRDPSIPSYTPAYPIGKPMTAFGIGKVERSDHKDFPVGKHVTGVFEMSDYVVFPASMIGILPLRVVDDLSGLPASTWIGALGMPGQTAYWSYYNIGNPKKGETIFVSSGAGAVGSVVGQLAKRDGLKVIGSSGSDDKVRAMKEEFGFDVAWNYKTESTADFLKANPPDIFFDNVGGETLDLVLQYINRHGRIIACGAISQYNLSGDQRYGLKNTLNIVAKQLEWRGFIMDADKDHTPFFKEMPGLVASGKVKTREHVTKGWDNGEAFVDMLEGRNEGKAVISLE